MCIYKWDFVNEKGVKLQEVNYLDNEYFKLPYDLSGSMAKNRFRNEMLWGLGKMFELYKADKDFTMVFDYVCDVEAHFKEKIEFYQLKTNNSATPYTVSKIAKPDKTGKSIIGKLYSIQCADSNPGIVSKLALVVNVPLKTLDKKVHSAEEEISFEDLDDKSLEEIKKYLTTECNVTDVDLKDCYYIYTSMDLFNPQDSMLGRMINFFVSVYGKEPKRATVLFQTLAHTIEIKAAYERKCSSYADLIDKKGFTKIEFEQIIKKAIDISDESIEVIKKEINLIYPEYSLKTKMNISVASIIRELRSNRVIRKMEDELVLYVMENLEKFDCDMVGNVQYLDSLYKNKFPIEYTLNERHALYIIVLVRIREGDYA